jgi:VWFA-related protein
MGMVFTDGLSRLRLGAALFVSGLSLISACAAKAVPQAAAAQTTTQSKDAASPATETSRNEKGSIKVNVELVLVRAIVHDKQGRLVENLRKEDFRLFDNGKEQAIAQFEAEAPNEKAQPAESSGSNAPDGAKATGAPPAVPLTSVSTPRFLALFFDDFSMSAADVIFARDAADRYLARNLRTIDQAAIVTASGTIMVDFTTDLKQLHEALFKLTPSGRGKNHDCPEISEYQAEEIIERESNYLPGPPPNPRGGGGSTPIPPPATQLAMAEAIDRCNIPSESSADLLPLVRSSAQAVLDRSRQLAQYRLEALNRLVNYISLMPGRRNIILVSSGFLTTAQQLGATSIIDRALRSQVIISSIDAKGLAVMLREADASQDYMPTQSNLVAERHQMDTDGQIAAGQVLAEVAESTGGKYFHNSNDLDAGFREAAIVSEPGYVLAFSPNHMKFDGTFHNLKVTLREAPHGYTLQARTGYFAPRQAPNPEQEAKQQIQDALRLRMDLSGLPVALRTKTATSATGPELLVWAHLDIRQLHFRRDGEQNVNSLTFVSAIFSREGKFLAAQEKQLQLNLPDDSLRQLTASGIDVTLSFPLKPGGYLVREVVTDSEEHRLAALSREVEIP